MYRRIIRSLTVFAALVVAYQAYVLLAVPVLDPPIELKRARRTPSGQKPGDLNPATKWQLLLSNYFPKDHWSQTQPPKVFASSNEQAIVVLDDYTRHAETSANNERYTQVDIKRFALLVFPTPPREGITPPSDAIILEAPQGARLKFDDFRPELGRIGQITGGKFPGRIVIHSDMHEPGPEDDLLVETADLEMNTKLLYSRSPVRFRLGQNEGGGRELEIRFLADEHVQPKDQGLKIAGIDSLEIRRDVQMRLHLETDSLLPGGNKEDDKQAEAATGPYDAKKPNADPVEVTCSGPFTFDFVRYVASLDRDVDLRMVHANGPSDQLFCSQLDLHFAPKQTPATDAKFVDAGERQQRDLGRLEPVAIVAQGHPVVVTSPRSKAQARGDRIQIALKEQRVRLAGAREAILVFDSNVLRAPVIDYQHPPRDSATPIGRFRATGPGSLLYAPDPTKPDQVFQAAWQTLIDLSREKGQPVLTLDGRPQFAFGPAGALTADQMKVYLRELQSDAPAGIGIPVSGGHDGEKLQVVPDRINARGAVDIQSSRLTGRTTELLVTFRPEPIAAVPAAGAPAITPTATPQSSFADKLTGGGAGGSSQQVFHIDSDAIKLDVQMVGQSASPTTLSCDGNVVFREVPLPGAQEKPLEIRGSQLTVDRLDTAPYVTLRGAKAAGALIGEGSGFAQLSGRGVTMLINMLELDVRENRMWSDGAGRATLLVTRDLEGQASPTPFPLELTWQGGLNFDGSTMLFDRDVVVAGADDTLRCDRLLTKLNTKIIFGEAIDQKAIDVSDVLCDGRVTINHVSRDETGVISHERVELAALSMNQQTGAISGTGPGVIRSTRFGNSLAMLGGAQNPAASPGAAGSKLNFLRVDFHHGLSGNMILRDLKFQERVRTVYGPVDAWEQELDATRPETLPPEAMTMTCNEMWINEDPVAARAMPAGANGQKKTVGPIQFRAKGNVQIDGQAPNHGAFSAQADQARYEQAKETFILEGDGRTPATLRRAGQTGPPPAARLIRYSRLTNEVSVEGIQFIEITPKDIETARRPGEAR
jgi:lipopolysaccharide export system protein LptA